MLDQQIREQLAALITEAQARALEAEARAMRERYPTDIFRPLTHDDHESVTDALKGYRSETDVSRDRISADMMRFAAAQMERRAAEIRADTVDIDPADIWDEGFTALAAEHAHQRADPTYPIHRRNPYRRESA